MHLHYNKFDENYNRRYIGFTTAAAIGLTTAAGALTTAGIATGAALTAGAVGLGVYGISKMTQQPKQQAAQAMPLPAAPSVEKAEIEAKETIANKRRAISRNKTIFTGPLGLSEEEKSGVNLKTLTGV